MRISNYVVSAFAATTLTLSAVSACAAPMHMGTFGGGHFGHFRSFRFHPGFDHRFAGAHFGAGEHFGIGNRFGHGRGRFFGGGLGLFAYGDGFGSDYGAPAVINSSFSGVHVVLGSETAPMLDDESHGDCLFRKLIYSADGKYVGQKTSRACY